MAGALAMLLPFAVQISLSLGIRPSPNGLLAQTPRWSNYVNAVTAIPFGLYFLNTATITGATLVGQVLSNSVAGYSFARLEWPGRNFMFVVMLGTMMLPTQVTLIPLYVLWRNLGLINTYGPLIIPSFFGSAWSVFLARQFFLTIPRELEDAARVDGCGYFSTYLRIILPISIPLVATLGILAFLNGWNDFFAPLIYLFDHEKYTLQLALANARGDYRMALSAIMLAPPILAFLFGQRYFLKSIILTGLRG